MLSTKRTLSMSMLKLKHSTQDRRRQKGLTGVGATPWCEGQTWQNWGRDYQNYGVRQRQCRYTLLHFTDAALIIGARTVVTSCRVRFPLHSGNVLGAIWLNFCISFVRSSLHNGNVLGQADKTVLTCHLCTSSDALKLCLGSM